MVNTRFWSDSWVRKINPLDRYLFIYLLTNERTNISGIYELPIEFMAFESGIDERDLTKSMLPKLEPKVYYFNGYVILPKFIKHQNQKSPQVQKGIIRELEEIPEEILHKAIEYGYPIDTLSHLTKLNLTLTKPNQTKKADKSAGVVKKSENTEIEEIIKAFEEVDKKNKTYYGNKTQRKACEFLVEEYGLESVLKAIKILPHSNKLDYVPVITSPYDLKEKWGKLATALQKHEDKKPLML